MNELNKCLSFKEGNSHFSRQASKVQEMPTLAGLATIHTYIKDKKM